MSPVTDRSPVEEPRLGGLGRRVAAHTLDAVLCLLSVLCVSFMIRILRWTGAWTPVGDVRTIWAGYAVGDKLAVMLAFVVATGPVYYTLCHASPWQATFGKRLLNIYVVANDGTRISLLRSFARELTVCLLGFFGGNLVSLFTIAVTPEQKAIHDFVCGTLVYRGRPTPGGSMELWRIALCFGMPIAWVAGTFVVITPAQ